MVKKIVLKLPLPLLRIFINILPIFFFGFPLNKKQGRQTDYFQSPCGDKFFNSWIMAFVACALVRCKSYLDFVHPTILALYYQYIRLVEYKCIFLLCSRSSLKALFPTVKNPIRSDVCFYPLERESTHIGSKVLLNSHLNS